MMFAALAVASVLSGMVPVPAGRYVPFFREGPPAATKAAPPTATPPAPAEGVAVGAFLLDVRPVTRAEFLAFVRAHPKWRRSKVPRVFADPNYLQGWKGDLVLPAEGPADAPVTEVSWFAASAYCRAQGKRLPTVAEWEYAATETPAQAKETSARILQWYGRPSTAPPPSAGKTGANRYGVRDLHGVVWEWVLDFNGSMMAEDGRKAGGGDVDLFCGSAGVRATDPSDYATFMRHAFRSSLKARYTVRNLGFRCARDREPR